MDAVARKILRLRLACQRIEPASTSGVAETVRHLTAIQAQDFAQALWAVGLRVPKSTRADVLAAFQAGEIVRTLPMRGTLHFIAAEDLRWMLGLTAARTLQSAAGRFRQLELDQSTLDRAERVVREALAGGGSIDRAGFMALLAANDIAPDGQRGYHVIFYLCQLGLICWGPPSGTQQALVLVDEWIAATQPVDRAEALENFALRYFSSHGPATERDFAWWTKLTLTDVRAAIAGLGDRLSILRRGDIDYYIATAIGETVDPTTPGAGIHALPGFDEYLLGYEDRSIALDAEHFERIVPGGNGIFLPTIVSRGRIVGTWRRNAKTKSIEPEHFAGASATQLGYFYREAARYSRFSAT